MRTSASNSIGQQGNGIGRVRLFVAVEIKDVLAVDTFVEGVTIDSKLFADAVVAEAIVFVEDSSLGFNPFVKGVAGGTKFFGDVVVLKANIVNREDECVAVGAISFIEDAAVESKSFFDGFAFESNSSFEGFEFESKSSFAFDSNSFFNWCAYDSKSVLDGLAFASKLCFEDFTTDFKSKSEGLKFDFKPFFGGLAFVSI